MTQDAPSKVTSYVVGFMFSPDLSRVALIRKIKPVWQAGKLNGIGGHVESSDPTSAFAIMREFQEETGYFTAPMDWHRFAYMSGGVKEANPDGWEIDFFCMTGDVDALKTTTKEEVVICHAWTISPGNSQTVENLPFLVSLAQLYLANGRPKFTTIEYPA